MIVINEAEVKCYVCHCGQGVEVKFIIVHPLQLFRKYFIIYQL